MTSLNLSNGYSLSISKIQEQDCQFVSLKLEESALGKLPSAELLIRGGSDVVDILDEITIKLVSPDSNQITANMYVYSIGYLNGSIKIKLLSGTPGFTRTVNTNVFSDVKTAVKSLYPGEILSNTESDLLNEVQVFQMRMSDYNFTKRLLSAWKKDSIFGFCLDGIRINDLTNFKSVSEELVDRITLDQFTIPELSLPKRYSMECDILDYSDSSDPNHSYVMFDKYYIPVNNEYIDLVSNYLYNQRFSSSAYISNFSAHTLYNLNITDGVKVPSPDSSTRSLDLYLSSRVIMIDLSDIKVDYTFKSISTL